jgi:hypothetical protein
MEPGMSKKKPRIAPSNHKKSVLTRTRACMATLRQQVVKGCMNVVDGRVPDTAFLSDGQDTTPGAACVAILLKKHTLTGK